MKKPNKEEFATKPITIPTTNINNTTKSYTIENVMPVRKKRNNDKMAQMIIETNKRNKGII